MNLLKLQYSLGSHLCKHELSALELWFHRVFFIFNLYILPSRWDVFFNFQHLCWLKTPTEVWGADNMSHYYHLLINIFTKKDAGVKISCATFVTFKFREILQFSLTLFRAETGHFITLAWCGITPFKCCLTGLGGRKSKPREENSVLVFYKRFQQWLLDQ